MQQGSNTKQPHVKETVEETANKTTEPSGVDAIEPDPVDEAETRSGQAWEKADDAVDDLNELGHENDEAEKP